MWQPTQLVSGQGGFDATDAQPDGEGISDDALASLHPCGCVSRIKASEEAGVKYMQKWEEKIIEREKALDFLEIPKDEWEKYVSLRNI